jgi:DNA-binding Xre family transcriptional regulator
MAQTTPLINTLKKTLKAHALTYADVARKFGLTEASVKRLFSEKSFSLQRLDQVCQMMDMEISDLVRLMAEDTRKITELGERQEEEIASDITLLLVTICVLNRWKLQEITAHYNISETDCIRYLIKLDRLQIIELLPGNRIKLLVAANFKWRENGPIQRFFQARVETEFFDSRFDTETEKLIVLNGMLAHESSVLLQRKLEKLAQEFNELNDGDTALELDHRHGTTMVLALRQWEYGLFKGLRRDM